MKQPKLVANFLGLFQDNFGIEPKDIHIVGHGVGAHIAGYVGTSVKNIERITGREGICTDTIITYVSLPFLEF